MPVARFVAVDHLPASRAVAAVHQDDGETLLLIARDRPAEEVAADLTEITQAGIDCGRWSQNWTGLLPPELRHAS